MMRGYDSWKSTNPYDAEPHWLERCPWCEAAHYEHEQCEEPEMDEEDDDAIGPRQSNMPGDGDGGGTLGRALRPDSARGDAGGLSVQGKSPPEENHRMTPLERFVRAVLLFHRGGQWTGTDRNEWVMLTNEEEATTRVLCDLARRLLQEGHA